MNTIMYKRLIFMLEAIPTHKEHMSHGNVTRTSHKHDV